jgi:hypothetical protein
MHRGLASVVTMRLVPVVFAVGILAACASDSQETTDSQQGGTTSSLSAAPASDTVAPSTGEPSTTSPATTTPTTTAPPTTTPNTTTPNTTRPPAADAMAACLQGTWLLDDQATAELHQALLPGFPLTVEGSQQLTFEGETVEYFVNEVLRFQPPGVDLSAPFDSRSAGSYAIDSDPAAGTTITMNYLTVEGGFPGVDGTVEDNEGQLLNVFAQAVGPDFTLPSIAGGPATCDGDVLTILVTSGLASQDARFVRLP